MNIHYQKYINHFFLKKYREFRYRQSKDHHTWWRSCLVGYPLALLLALGASLIPGFEIPLGVPSYFIEPPCIIATLLVGWIWGIGPAFLAMVVEMLAVDYWVTPPLGAFTFYKWPDVLSYVSFITVQLAVLGLLYYRRRLLFAKQELQKRATELARSNQMLVQTNEQLEQANRVKDSFLCQASHELKTPLTTLQGHAQLALRRLAWQDPLPPNLAFIPSHLKKVEAQTHHLDVLVDNLLNLSTMRSGKIPLQVTYCDLCHICREVVENQSMLAGRQIDLKLASSSLPLQADEEKLSQVITNLITNALKYSPASSAVQVELNQSAEQAVVSVHNEGSVISHVQQANIFEPFYRTPEAQASATRGWGLGLAISKEIVTHHDGRIWVESSEEAGTTFFISLPLKNPVKTPLNVS